MIEDMLDIIDLLKLGNMVMSLEDEKESRIKMAEKHDELLKRLEGNLISIRHK